MRNNHYFYNNESYFDPTAGIACVKIDREIRKNNKKTNKPVFHLAWTASAPAPVRS